MNALRLTSSLVIAMLMTTFLFLLMQSLITYQFSDPVPTPELPRIGFFDSPKQIEPEPVPEPKESPEPQELAEQPAAPTIELSHPFSEPAVRLPVGRQTLPGADDLAPPVVRLGQLGGDGDSPMIVAMQLPPVYPPTAVLRGIEGYVVVQMTITSSGAVSDIKILESKPGRMFVDAVMSAIQRSRYRPAYRDGEPIAVSVVRTFDFTLEGQQVR